VNSQKTAGELAQAYEARLIEQHTKPLVEFIHELLEHLDYVGWGDSWERECSEELRQRAQEWQKANPVETARLTYDECVAAARLRSARMGFDR
jgi:hypothetical protein